MDISAAKINARIARIINRLIFLEKKTIFHHQNLTLHPSELHLMLAVYEDRAVNGTEIAERLGVTKGAVSQTLARLEKKGVITKTKDPYNKNELTVAFTPLGLAAIERFRKRQASLASRYDEYLSSLSKSERRVIEDFLSRMEVFLNHIG